MDTTARPLLVDTKQASISQSRPPLRAVRELYRSSGTELLLANSWLSEWCSQSHGKATDEKKATLNPVACVWESAAKTLT